MKICEECKNIIEKEDLKLWQWNEFAKKMAEQKRENYIPQFYHVVHFSVGSGNPGVIGCHIESRECGPVRDMTPEELSEQEEIEKLENLLGEKL